MPARVIRGEIVSSESLSHVSLEAELVFMRLLLVVDDYGRADARLPLLRSQLFPMRAAFTERKLAVCLDELTAGNDPPVRLYEHEGRAYLYLPKWEIHRGKTKRSQTSRFPDPNEAIPGDPGRSADPRPRVGVGVGVGVGEGVTLGGAPAPSAEDPVAPDGAPRVSASGKRAKPKNPPETLCPDRLDPEDRDALIAWARERGMNESHCRWAFNAVKDWSRSNNERRADWLATTRNGMRRGWALEGYRETDEERYQRELAESPFRLLSGGASDA